MRERGVRRVLVCDADRKLVGIVSLGDLALQLDPDSALSEISEQADLEPAVTGVATRGSLARMPEMPTKLAEIVDEFAAAPRDVVLEMLLEFADAVPPLPGRAGRARGHGAGAGVPDRRSSCAPR